MNNSSGFKVIISNGFNKFHMAVAAAEAERRGILSSFITGAYPTLGIRWVSRMMGLSRNQKFARLIARGEAINDQSIEPAWCAESLYNFAWTVRRITPQFAKMLEVTSFRIYGRQAVRPVIEAARDGARIYHYRAGFGGDSVKVAAQLGMVTLCDYSIAHAAVLFRLIANDGVLSAAASIPQLSRLWLDILADTEQADFVLVNSDFVKNTFLEQGWDAARLWVIYWGVDDAFLNAVPTPAQNVVQSDPLRLMFAGGFERRKGAETIIAALRLLHDVHWTMEIAGVVDADANLGRDFFKDPRISVPGWLARTELARRMAAAEVFVFPSLAEGSARVVFEALAAGMYVITTPNAGSIVQDGVHGRLIAPGDPQGLADAIREAARNRAELAAVGRRNAELIRSHYRQSDYGAALAALYFRLLADRDRDGPGPASPSAGAAI